MSDRLLKKGTGWRIGWNPNAVPYQGLIGGKDWAIELTKAEFKDFCRLFKQLAETMEIMSQELMDVEKIACEAESDFLWLEVEGYPHAYSLRLILNQGRCCEGNWSEEMVRELLQVVKIFEIS
ncbi:DUF1818 family protein [cyanobacterium endosymbiont of Epithemia turgida]|uniref:DUF1818 family protein n=1 Tax=cyanobacterium endosymbiont of Epithemia turgida TaxID=718217 RepID=UPI0004D1406C|nr:DUF1818 family protein [cyanobacterium endosymbiont of Epithemia turgida]BAP17066.1 hypothetical protein ETSB_0177 [cyanobacterium endosymbiont of Epithemia turgida isolate EtSB Lake Yunoko]